jgi:hypothetical protein
MALKRLDEEFELKPGTQLLPYMKRLLPSLEGRFQSIEADRETYEEAIEELRGVALLRINEILIPATKDIIEVTKFGFLLGPSSSSVKLEIGPKTFVIDEGSQRDTFTPSPYLIIEHTFTIDNYAIARLVEYDNSTGILLVTITAVHGDPGPHTDWVISSTPGMADSTKLYHDAVGPMHDQVRTDAAQVAADKTAVQQAADALFAAGLDAQSFIRKDATVDFLAPQKGVAPASSSNDTTFPTTGWTRARIIEYAGNMLSKTGGTMSGPITLSGPPSQPLHATTKEYVDSIIGQGGTIQGLLTIRSVNPTFRLQVTGTQQNRIIEGLSAAGVARWQLHVGNGDIESGGNVGSNFMLHRYSDGGAYLGAGLHIARDTAVVTTYNRLDVSTGGSNINGNLHNAGDFWTYRADNTGVVWLGNQRTARLYWNGGTFDFNGAINNQGNALNSGHFNCYSLSTQGYYATVWGLTSHGAAQVNGKLTVNGGEVEFTGLSYNMLRMWDNDWGMMYLHHQNENVGFLNNGGGWIWYINNNGHMWASQYGWLHDYVNGRASAYAWDAANYRYNQCVTAIRWVHAGDIDFGAWWYQFAEIGNACITGLNMATPYYGGPGVFMARWRQAQNLVAGNWYTCGWAS